MSPSSLYLTNKSFMSSSQAVVVPSYQVVSVGALPTPWVPPSSCLSTTTSFNGQLWQGTIGKQHFPLHALGMNELTLNSRISGNRSSLLSASDDQCRTRRANNEYGFCSERERCRKYNCSLFTGHLSLWMDLRCVMWVSLALVIRATLTLFGSCDF